MTLLRASVVTLKHLYALVCTICAIMLFKFVLMFFYGDLPNQVRFALRVHPLVKVRNSTLWRKHVVKVNRSDAQRPDAPEQTADPELTARWHAQHAGVEVELSGGPRADSPEQVAIPKINAMDLSIFVYDILEDIGITEISPSELTPHMNRYYMQQFAFELRFRELMQQSARRVLDPTVAEFFYIPILPILYSLQHGHSIYNCASCRKVDAEVVKRLRSFGPYWDTQRERHFLPGLRCPLVPGSPHSRKWGLVDTFPQIWGGGALLLCNQATTVDIDPFRALHVMYDTSIMGALSTSQWSKKDLLATQISSIGPQWHGPVRAQVDVGMRQCRDCKSIVLESRDPVDLKIIEQFVRRSYFNVIAPGDIPDRPSRDQSIRLGSLPVILDGFDKAFRRHHFPCSDVLNWSDFSVHFMATAEERSGLDFWPRLEEVLRSLVSSGESERMLANLAKVEHRFHYSNYGVIQLVFEMLALRVTSRGSQLDSNLTT